MKKAVFILLFSVFAVKGFSDAFDFSAVCESGQTLYYKIISGDHHEVEVIAPGVSWSLPSWDGYAEPVGDLVIPEMVENNGIVYTVVSIGLDAFRDCQEIASVVLPANIRRIYGEAFFQCRGLSGDLVIPDNCTFIGGYAFKKCKITSLTIGSAVDTIQGGAFASCTSLQTIQCNTPTLPYIDHDYFFEETIFNSVPADIPVYVNCLAFDQFHMSMDWSRFTQMDGVFLGAPSLTVEVNNPVFGTAEVVSVPEGCDDATATVRATPSPGHVFGCWKRNGTVVSDNAEYTFILDRDVTLIACFDQSVTVYDTIGYPVHVVGRKMNSSGQVVDEIVTDFIYNTENGQLTQYSFPGGLSTTSFSFYQYPDKPSYICTVTAEGPKDKGPGPWYDTYSFTYEDDQKKHEEHYGWCNAFDDPHDYWDYYYEDHHLTQVDYSSEYEDVYDTLSRHLYSYENGYKTRIDQYYQGHSDSMSLSSITINHYNERQQILTSQTDTYNNSGEITTRTLKTYTYTAHNKTDSIITQTYNDGIWANSGMAHYVYDMKNRVVEYQTGSWSMENATWNVTKRVIYDFNDDLQTLTVSFRKINGDEWGWDYYSNQSLFNDSRLYEWQRVLRETYGGSNIGQFVFNMYYEMEEVFFLFLSEWYYQIKMENGDITYQHLEYASDTTINNDRAKVIVRTNQIYDKEGQTQVTHEYIKEEDNRVYWWNKELHEFTMLYDYAAKEGDEWEIKVGTESILVHVDGVEAYEHDGETYKMLHISDVGDVFSGDIVVGIGHTTSFFPEKLMRGAQNYKVDGLRCYLVQDALLYHDGNKDCDAVSLYAVDENGTEGLVVYPNPTDGILHIAGMPHNVGLSHCGSPTGQTEYRITNLMGQILLSGQVETCHGASLQTTIDVSSLPSGMYFITLGHQTLKFTKR